MAGTLVLTDTIAATLHDTFAGMHAGTDAVIRDRPPAPEFGDQRSPVDAALVATVAAVDGVEAAEGRIQGPVQLLDPRQSRRHLQPDRSAPWRQLGRGRPAQPLPARRGTPAAHRRGGGHDRGSAKQTGYRVGDTVTVLSPDLAGRLQRLPEVKAAAGIRQGPAVIGAPDRPDGRRPRQLARVVDLRVTSGRLQDLDAAGIAVLDTVATANGWSVGDRVPVRFPETGQQRLTVAAIYHTKGVAGSYLVGLPVYQANFARQVDGQVLVDRADGVSAAAARAAIGRVLADYPTVKLQDQAELKQAQATQIDQFLNFVYLLLALAVVIALLGIANTLALSILERTRELGLLRAVGMTRRQLCVTVRYEAVIIALFGTVLGLLIAVFFGCAMVTAVAEEQVRLAVPAPQLAVAALAAALAAALPARRASRLDVLAAIATE